MRVNKQLKTEILLKFVAITVITITITITITINTTTIAIIYVIISTIKLLLVRLNYY